MPDLNSLPPSSLLSTTAPLSASNSNPNLSSSTSNPPLPSSPPPPISPAQLAVPTTMSSANDSNNELPSSPTRRQAGSPSPSPSRTASTSLQAAAAVNAGLQHQGSRRSSGSLSRQVTTSSSNGRRRSQVLMNLQLNDPAVPGPGEMVQDTAHRSNLTSPIGPLSSSPLMTAGDPPHHRAPSLGELHQELEAEQEAQVNRLLLQIRQQQTQILHLQNQSAIAGEDSPGQTTPGSSAQPIPSTSHSHSAVQTAPSTGSLPRSPVFPRSSFDLARSDFRHRSRTPSRGASPRLRSTSISQESGEPFMLGGRDENAFYQAETQMLTRENQMLRHRIRDLERQLDGLGGGTAAVTREPVHHSSLTRSESVSEEARPSGPAAVSDGEGTFSIRETPKDE